MDPFIGEIRLFAGSYAPANWQFCAGQLLPIRQYTALFSLLGTYYGGDGRVTFALPDLRGRVPMGAGAGPGLTPRSLGEIDGAATHTLTTPEMSVHSHNVACSRANGTKGVPNGGIFAGSQSNRQTGAITDTPYDPAPDQNKTMNVMMLVPAGGSQPHNNMQPYVGLNYIIAMNGVFPPRP
jgi:microcystin-dependent protein